MDNRKAFRGHQRRPSMMDRMKRVFSQPHAIDSHGSTQNQPSTQLPHTMPGSFVHKSISPASREHSSPSLEPAPTPTKLLADFFAKKGNLQLSPVEYAGVLALMAKATPQQDLHSATKLGDTTVDSTNSISKDSLRNSAAGFPARDHTMNANTTVLSRSSRRPSASAHRSFRVPSANTSLASTLDYTPAYHTFSGHSAVPVRRVHRFAGLPLPYRTRIRAPSLRSSAPSPHQSMLSNTSISLTKTGHHVSQTASALRTILDTNLLAQPSPDRFANPYAHTRKRRHPSQSAKEIELLLAFDKSVPITKDATVHAHKKANNTVKEPSPVPFTLAPASASASASASAPKPASILVVNDASSLPPSAVKKNPVAAPLPPITKEISSDSPHTSETSQKYPFPFPQPHLKAVNIDRSQVEQYKSLYLF